MFNLGGALDYFGAGPRGAEEDLHIIRHELVEVLNMFRMSLQLSRLENS